MVTFHRLLASAAVILLAFSSREAAASIQITGTVVGTVTEGETGKPVTGAQVFVEGTGLGITTTEDGSYRIENAPVGLHDLTVQYRSDQRTRENLRILAGQTMRVDFEVIERVGPMLKRTQLVSHSNVISTLNPRRYAQAPSVDIITGLGVGIYPHPQLLPVPGVRRPVGRDEVSGSRAVELRAGGATAQPRLEVPAWSLESPDVRDQPEDRPEDKQ